MKAKTIKELRGQLVEIFDEVRSDKIELNAADTLYNGAGKICSTIKNQLEYHKLRKDKPEIDFLKCH